MNYLHYKSEEMFSATQLIRKSKLIFDKVNTREIDKAIILRDGKPTFILFDFEEYEKIMKKYQMLEEIYNNHIEKQKKTRIQKEINSDEMITKDTNSRDNLKLETKKHDRDGEIIEFWN